MYADIGYDMHTYVIGKVNSLGLKMKMNKKADDNFDNCKSVCCTPGL